MDLDDEQTPIPDTYSGCFLNVGLEMSERIQVADQQHAGQTTARSLAAIRLRSSRCAYAA